MSFDYAALEILRQNHPSWRLLRSDHVLLIASFLQRIFIAHNTRLMTQADLAEALEDELFKLRANLGANAFPKSAGEYLNDWTANGWLRKFYRHNADEPYFDLTPATEKTINWLDSLIERKFIGTESRLLTVLDLLKQINHGSDTNPAARINELLKYREQVDREINRLQHGEINILDDNALKDRFQQFMQLARELLSDFREVENNFRNLDRQVRERIALWEGGKGELLEQIMAERDAIDNSDQGRNFRAFWDFLMSSSRQEELSIMLEKVLTLPSIMELKPDERIQRIHYDWLEAGEQTQRTIAQLSQQLRHFLDNHAWLENRRIMDIIRNIEVKSLTVRDQPPLGEIMNIDETNAAIELPMERPLYSPTNKLLLNSVTSLATSEAIDTSALFSQVVINKPQLMRNIRHALQDRTQITLKELCAIYPLRQGLAEIIAYLQLAGDACKAVIDEHTVDIIIWHTHNANGAALIKQAQLPRIIFVN